MKGEKIVNGPGEYGAIGPQGGAGKKAPRKRISKKELRQYWRQRLTELHFFELEKKTQSQ